MNSREVFSLFGKVRSPLISTIYKSDNCKFELLLTGKKRNFLVEIHSFPKFPNCFPCARLLEPDLIGQIPHVNVNGTICMEFNDTIVFDINKPVEVLQKFIEKIVELLNDACLKINIDELHDEIEGFFIFKKSINSFYFPEDKTEQIHLKLANSNIHNGYLNPILLYDRSSELPSKFSNVASNAKHQTINIIHLALLEPIELPNSMSNFSFNIVADRIKNLPPKSLKNIEKYLKGMKSQTQFFILISMPRPSGGRTQLLLEFKFDKPLHHPLKNYDGRWKIEAIEIIRNNKEHVIERGGASTSLNERKITLIGCGSVGGEISMMLAKSGIGKLLLVDSDTIEIENIYRHRLGGASLNYLPNSNGTVKNKSKANALAALISTDMPDIEVNVRSCDFDQILDDREFLESDLIIVAVGSPATNLSINRTLKELNIPNAIFCWNEAAGYGGHSVAVDYSKNCLECLYTDRNGFSLECSLNLLKVGQAISKNLTGCAGVFTPFSYLDSSKTANLATQQAIQFLLQNIGNAISSWKGTPDSLLKTTSRYQEMPLMLEEPFRGQERCVVCHG